MARTAVTVNSIGLNGSAAVTPDALDATNGHSVACDRDDLTLIVYNSAVTTKNLTIKARSGVAAEDKVIAVATTETRIIVNLESARYKQTDGKIYLDLAAGFTGTIIAVKDAI